MTKLTKRYVDSMPNPAQETILWDDDLAGFGVRIYPTGRKVFVVQYKLHGRTRRKFADPEYFEKLQSTGTNYLIEGNDWKDTFWGMCEGRGRNVLGRLIMNVRDTPLATLSKQAGILKKIHSKKGDLTTFSNNP